MERLVFLCLLSIGCATTAHAESQKTWRAMAFNVLYSGSDHRANVDAIARASPDILCLREVRPDFVRRFEKRLPKKLPHYRFKAKKQGTWGTGIASKHPIERFRVFPEKPHRLPASEAVIRIGRQRVVVVCVHLIPAVAKHNKEDSFFTTMEKNDQLRTKQARYLLKRYRHEKRPILLLGDFNESTDDAAMTLLQANGFRDACDSPKEDCGATWPGATSPLHCGRWITSSRATSFSLRQR